MKIYVVGSSKNRFLPFDNIRTKFLIDTPHDGDNIDSLNPWYCELTGLYHLWKHVDDEIVGLEHYRRYFANYYGRLLSENEILQILSTYDIICAQSRYSKSYPVIAWINEHGKRKDFDKYLYILNRYFDDIGDEKYHGFGEWCKRYLYGDHHCLGNMFVCNKSLINDYCTWLFDTLSVYDQVNGLSNANRRIDGYLAEFLFGAWLEWNKKKINYKHIILL